MGGISILEYSETLVKESAVGYLAPLSTNLWTAEIKTIIGIKLDISISNSNYILRFLIN